MIIERIGHRGSPYLTRVKLTPSTRWGGLYLHIFHRPDVDPDPHDHPWDFWTMPLTRRGYLELVMDEWGQLTVDAVLGWRWTRRRAEHTHILLGPERWAWLRTQSDPGAEVQYPGRLATLVWHGPKRRDWGFRIRERWVPWRDYVERRDR